MHNLTHLKLTAPWHAYSWRWSEMRERDNQRQLADHHDAVIGFLEDGVSAGELSHGNFRAAPELIFAAYTYALRKAVFSAHDADKLITHLEPQLMITLQGLGHQDQKKEQH